MRIYNFLIVACALSLAACAGNKAASGPAAQSDYVEIENPGMTMSPGAPATIWVPRSYVESGLPRGGQLLKKGYESARRGIQGASDTGDVSQVPALNPRSAALKKRISVLEVGRNNLAVPFKENLSMGVAAPVIAAATESADAELSSRPGLSAYAVTARQKTGINLLLVVSAPDGIAPGKQLVAELYDAMGGGMVNQVDAALPVYIDGDPIARNTAISSTLASLTRKSENILALVPWYCRIVAVEGDKVFIDAGREAGVNVGQKMKIFRGGKAIEGLGFDPGSITGTLLISGFVGPNGAYGLVKDGVQVRTTDVIGVE